MIKKLYLIFILSLSFLAVGFATDTYINGCGTYALASNTNYYLNFTSYTTLNDQCILLSGTTNAKISNVQILGYQNKQVKQLGSSSNSWFVMLQNTFTGYVDDEDYFFDNIKIKNINYEGSAPFTKRNYFVYFNILAGDRGTLIINDFQFSNNTINQLQSSFSYNPIYIGSTLGTWDTQSLQFNQKDFYTHNNINISNNFFSNIEVLFYTNQNGNPALPLKVLNNFKVWNNILRNPNVIADGFRFFQGLTATGNLLYFTNMSIQENTILNFNNASIILELGSNYCKYTLNPSGVNNNLCNGGHDAIIKTSGLNIISNDFNFGSDNSITHITAPLNDTTVLVNGYTGQVNINYYHKLVNVTSPIYCGIDFVKKSENKITSLSLISTSVNLAYNTLSTFTAINFLNNTEYKTKVACDTELNTFTDTILNNFNFNSKIEFSDTTEFTTLYTGSSLNNNQLPYNNGNYNNGSMYQGAPLKTLSYSGGINYINSPTGDLNTNFIDTTSALNSVDNIINFMKTFLNGWGIFLLPLMAFFIIIICFLIFFNLMRYVLK